MFGSRSEQNIEPMLLTSRQAAKLLNISERTLWTFREAGEIPCVRIGRSVRYSVDALQEYIRHASERVRNLPE